MSPATNRLSNEVTSWRKRFRRPTKRGQKFVEGVARGMTDLDAAVAAGYSLSVAKTTKKKLWCQPSIQAHFQSLVRKVLPPERVAQVYKELLEGRSVTTHLMQERVVDENGNASMQVVSLEQTETVDRRVQLRALKLAIEHGGLTPSSIHGQGITSAPLAEVLQRAEQEHIRNRELMTPK